jgi:hypothetical protein
VCEEIVLRLEGIRVDTGAQGGSQYGLFRHASDGAQRRLPIQGVAAPLLLEQGRTRAGTYGEFSFQNEPFRLFSFRPS